MKYFIGTVVAFIVFCTIAKAEDVSIKMKEIMWQIRHNELNSYEYGYFCSAENALSTIVAAGNYYSDSLPDIRCQAYRYASKAALRCESDSVKMMVVEDLLRSCNDSVSIVVQNAWQELMCFNRKYYSDRAKLMLEQVVEKETFFAEKFFLIGGYVGSGNMPSTLKNKRTVCAKEQKWYIDLALCRLNDKSAVEMTLSRLSKIKPSLDFIDDILPDLLYTRQRAIYDWIINEAMTDECQCVSRSPISERPIPCSHYIMYEIADYIDGFPISRDEDGEKDDDFSRSEIKKMRTWLKVNPNYKIIDADY